MLVTKEFPSDHSDQNVGKVKAQGNTRIIRLDNVIVCIRVVTFINYVILLDHIHLSKVIPLDSVDDD